MRAAGRGSQRWGPPAFRACGRAAWARRAAGGSGGGSQRSGASSQPFPAGEEPSEQSTKCIYNRPSGHLRTWVLQPAGLHLGLPVPSLPLAAGWVTPLWLRPDGALRAAALVTAAPGRQSRFGEKPGRETPHQDREGETSSSAEGSGGLRPPWAPWPVPQQAGGPAGHWPAPVPGLFPPTRGLMSFCQGIVWSGFHLYMAKSLCELSLWTKMLWSGYYTSTFLRSNSLGQYIL